MRELFRSGATVTRRWDETRPSSEHDRQAERCTAGAQTVAALLYSLIESAKLSGVDPKRSLLTATGAAIVDRTAVTQPRDFLVARERGVTAATVAHWREHFLGGGQAPPPRLVP